MHEVLPPPVERPDLPAPAPLAADKLPMPLVSVVVPCFDEEGAVRQTLQELRRHLTAIEPYEILAIDDGSRDRTGAILEELVGQAVPPGGESDLAKSIDPNPLVVIRQEYNRGYGAALKVGIRRARAPLVIITDADGTYPNHRLPELVALAQRERADMVVGARTLKDEVTYPLIRRIPKVFLARWASWLAGQPIPDINSGMRIFRREAALEFFRILPDTFSFTTTITIAMLSTGKNVRYVPIGYAARVGKSKIKPIRDTLRFVQLITRTGMYFAPLRVLWPVILLLGGLFLASLAFDLFWLQNLTDKTVLLFMFTLNTGMFALLADMIHRRAT